MKKSRFLMPLLMAVALALMPLISVQAAKPPTVASKSNPALNSSEIDALLRKRSNEQTSYFSRIVLDRLKYVTDKSFVGKDGKWLGFVDLYAQYKNGSPTGYILERASVQYGMQKMPTDTESCTLKIGDRSTTLLYNSKEPMGFTFPTTPIVNLSSSAANSTPSFTLKAGSSTVNLGLDRAYPSSDIPSMQSALTAMAPAYVNYIESNSTNGGFDHCVLRLRSYISDSSTLSRNYSWELSLIHGSNLPSKTTIIRYDCNSEKINISQRELRSYFY